MPIDDPSTVEKRCSDVVPINSIDSTNPTLDVTTNIESTPPLDSESSTFTEDPLKRTTTCPVCSKEIKIITIHLHHCFRWKKPTGHESQLRPQKIKSVTKKVARLETSQLQPRGARFNKMIEQESVKADKRKAKIYSFAKKSTLVAQNEFYGRKRKNKNVTP